MTDSVLNADDAFILGNLCGMAINAGKGAEVASLYRCLQVERPTNAGGFIFEAMTLQQDGDLIEALEVLERLMAQGAIEKNGEEALAHYVGLLAEVGDIAQAYDISKRALMKNQVISESARRVFSEIIAAIESAARVGA